MTSFEIQTNGDRKTPKNSPKNAGGLPTNVWKSRVEIKTRVTNSHFEAIYKGYILYNPTKKTIVGPPPYENLWVVSTWCCAATRHRSRYDVVISMGDCIWALHMGNLAGFKASPVLLNGKRRAEIIRNKGFFWKKWDIYRWNPTENSIFEGRFHLKQGL